MAVAKKQVFISYAREDRKAAEELAEALRGESLSVWIDSQGIAPGDNWPRQVADALEHSEAMVVLVSPHSVESEGVRRDVAYALTSKRFERRLIPVVIGTERARWLDKVPWVLQRQTLLFAKSPAKASKQVAETLKAAG